MFFSNMFNDQQKDAIKANKAWPVIMTLHAEMGMYVWRAVINPNDLTKFYLCDIWGFPQMLVKVKADGVIEVLSNQNSNLQKDPISILESSNVKYILTRINRLRREDGSTLARTDMRGMPEFGDQIKHMFHQFFDQYQDSTRRKVRPEYGGTLRREIAEVYAGRRAMSEISKESKERLDEAIRMMDKNETDNKAMREKIRHYVEGPKFVIGLLTNPIQEIIFGGFTIKNIDEIFDNDYNNEYSWGGDVRPQFDITMPFAVYKSLEHIPYEIKDTVMGTLHLNKMNRTSRFRFSDTDHHLIPWGVQNLVPFDNSSQLCFRSNNSTPYYMFTDKRGLA